MVVAMSATRGRSTARYTTVAMKKAPRVKLTATGPLTAAKEKEK